MSHSPFTLSLSPLLIIFLSMSLPVCFSLPPSFYPPIHLSQVMELCRPSDSRLEHVDFECLFSCLSLRLLLGVFGSLLLERRVIFTADKLRCDASSLIGYSTTVWQS